MALLTTPVMGIGQADFVSSATARHKLGTRVETDDGRVFRYVKAGTVDLVAGNVLQSPAIIAAHLGMSLTNPPNAAALGATTVAITPGAATATADFYADGLLQVDTAPGNGYAYGVLTHAAIASGTAFTLYLKEPIQVALTSASRLGLIANPYNGVIASPLTTATGIVVGVATYVISANQWGWVQTWGLASVLITGTPALGSQVIGVSATAAGTVDLAAAATLITGQQIARMAQIGVAGKNNFCYLGINP